MSGSPLPPEFSTLSLRMQVETQRPSLLPQQTPAEGCGGMWASAYCCSVAAVLIVWLHMNNHLMVPKLFFHRLSNRNKVDVESISRVSIFFN